MWNGRHALERKVSDFALVFRMEAEDEDDLDPAPALIRETLVHLDFSRRGEEP